MELVFHVLCLRGCVFGVLALLVYFRFPFFRLSLVPVARRSLASVLRYQSRAPTWQVFCRSWAASMAGALIPVDGCVGVSCVRLLMFLLFHGLVWFSVVVFYSGCGVTFVVPLVLLNGTIFEGSIFFLCLCWLLSAIAKAVGCGSFLCYDIVV